MPGWAWAVIGTMGLLIVVGVVVTLLLVIKPGPTPSPGGNGGEPSLIMSRIAESLDVTSNGKKGIRISLAFRGMGMKGTQCEVLVRLYDSDGRPMKAAKDATDQFNGQVATYVISPVINQDPMIWDDFSLFIPYDQIPLPAGRQEIQYDF